MAYNVRKMDRVQKDYQAGSKGAKAMGAEMRKIFNDGDEENGNGEGTGGGSGGGEGKKGLFGKKEGGTKFGNLLRTIGSKFTKDQTTAETADVESGQTTTGDDTTITPENVASNVKPNGDTSGEESKEVKLYSSMNPKDKAAAEKYNMDTYGSHNPSKDAKLAGISKEELAKRFAATQQSTSEQLEE